MKVSHFCAAPAAGRRCDAQRAFTRRGPGRHRAPCNPNGRRLATKRQSILIALTVSLASLSGTHAQATITANTYTCQPSLSVFCRNIHVNCAGATRIPTVPFKITISGVEARIQIHSTHTQTTGQVFRDKVVLIELAASNDWIRIEQDGRYIHRIYRNGQAAMSYGTCQLIGHRKER